jgi:hypothetical protein
MTKRGLQLLEAHIRSFDPGEPTALERLERALGEPLAQELRFAVLGACADAQGEGLDEGLDLGGHGRGPGRGEVDGAA